MPSPAWEPRGQAERRARFPAFASAVSALPQLSTAMLCARRKWPALRPCRPNVPSTWQSPRAAVREGVVPGAGDMGGMDF